MKRSTIVLMYRSLVIILIAAFLPNLSALDKKEYRVYIVSDTLKEKFIDLQNGFRETLDKQLAALDAKANYTVFDTKTDKATVPGIIKAIQDGQPDLIAVVNSSGVFADLNISMKLSDPKYKFVSENCIPVQSGVAKTWEKPGGNITGVGVFIQYTSTIRLVQLINPLAKKLVFFTWDNKALAPLNAYFELEMKAAAKATGVDYEFRRIATAEDQYDFYLEMDKKWPETFIIGGSSAWVHRDGTPADMNVEEGKFVRENVRHNPLFANEETVVRNGATAGTCVIWYDLGAQMADKGMKILQGANPGDIPWDYPRKYNLMFNIAMAKKIGLNIPANLLGAAYRVYTDFDGHYSGQKN